VLTERQRVLQMPLTTIQHTPRFLRSPGLKTECNVQSSERYCASIYASCAERVLFASAAALIAQTPSFKRVKIASQSDVIADVIAALRPATVI
jgi:hypothetical protein